MSTALQRVGQGGASSLFSVALDIDGPDLLTSLPKVDGGRS
jgi:hypothetical protein